MNNELFILATSGQDGGIGRHASHPCATIRRITTKLTTKYNQNCQKTEPNGSLTTKDLKKKYSFRRVGRVETRTQAERTQCGGSGLEVGSEVNGWMHIQVWKIKT